MLKYLSDRRRVAWLATFAAAVLAVLPGIVGLLQGRTVHMESTVAVLTATLIAVIWYTRFTYEALELSRSQIAAERTRAKASLATALLAEIQWLLPRLKGYFQNPRRATGSLAHPVLSEVIKNATLFDPSTIRRHRRLPSVTGGSPGRRAKGHGCAFGSELG
jgi:hypothetical protein